MQRFAVYSLILIAACASIAHGANVDGSFDIHFAGTGHEVVDVSPDSNDQGKVLRIQPDGKLLMTGTCGGIVCATRLRANGSYDNGIDGFGPARVGYLHFDSFIGFPTAVLLTDTVLLNDGRILLVGTGFTPQTSGAMVLASLAANGSALDPGMGGGAGYIRLQYDSAASVGNALLVQADHKILIAGYTTGPNGNDDMAIKRLMPDFSVDTAFGVNGHQTIAFELGGPSGADNDGASSVAVQSDGRILLAGTAQAQTSSEIAVARLLANGQPDPSFGTNQDGRVHFPLPANNPYTTASAMRIDSRGRIVLVGTTKGSNTSAQCVINRLLTDGSQDSGFHAGIRNCFMFPSAVSTAIANCSICRCRRMAPSSPQVRQ